ncbi:MAG TPA: metal-dependent hydrolase [Bacillota bacterium]|jgi:inner membrane protein|nr:metal-dependent hydrolase [Bacillota bacterium]
MDTGTHIVMGIALGGLATIDPAVQNDPTLFTAVLAGTVIGSHAPDFDTIFKLRNNATYIRHHRGASHSLPAIILWGFIVSGIIFLFVPEVNFFHLWLWTFIAVCLHVFVDLFNAYGTQAFRPFTSKWIALGFINTFDPYIFGLNVVFIIAWILGANPGITWAIIYAVIVLYYIKRYLDKREIREKIKEFYPNAIQIVTSPTMKQNYWRVAISTNNRFYVGTVENGHIEIIDEFEKVPLPDTPVMEAAKKDKNIASFLNFSPVYRWEITEFETFIEVRFIDLRYRSKGYYPFVAVVQLDRRLDIISSYTGWIFSEHKLKRKLLTEDA